MEAASYFAFGFFRKVFQLFSIITLTFSLVSTTVPTSSQWSNSDRSSLLAIKSQIELDPLGALSSWNNSLHHCDWKGITCSRRHSGRVTILYLKYQKLQGTLSPYIGNLTFLLEIYLEDNNFHDVIPQEIWGLRRLISLDLVNNHFSGNILPVVFSLTKINHLYLHENYFSGTIPSSLGNLSSLTEFSIAKNYIEGSIPAALCSIPKLSVFQVGSNNLTGEIPSCLYNQSSMHHFIVANNQLEGSPPSDIFFTLPKIIYIDLSANRFSGPIPTSLPNATNLELFDIQMNNFTGSVPTNVGMLKSLQWLSINSNQLGTKTVDDLKFVNSLTNCTNLEVLQFGDNFLKGQLPVSISNLSAKLRTLRGRRNMIYGEIPAGLGNLVNLEAILLENNVLSGQIPTSLGNLAKLSWLYLGNNLHGSIPPTLGNCTNLLVLQLSHNNLVGTIPTQLFGTNVHIILLDFMNNALTGSLPSQVSNLTSLMYLYLSNNKLSGRLPESLGNCLSLESLFLENNIFKGEIPKSLKPLWGLSKLDLSQNVLSGEIPDYLGKLPLKYLNLSFNHLEGEVPNIGVFGNTSAFFVDGNTNLCGGIWELKLPSCMQKGKKSSPSIKVILPVIVGSLCLLAFSCMLLMRYKRKTSRRKSLSRAIFTPWYKRVLYGELFKATNGFSDENLIGVGLHGLVFKGILEHINNIVAVKVIKLQIEGASKSFLKECNALKNLRHRNLLKIITVCSTVDFKGNNFKALVFDFMSNGSLESWLHPRANEQQTTSRVLNFLHRLNITIDVASALEYLHHHCQPYFVHCDVKPSNVLLDNEMTAHVADFGITKMFSTSSYDSSQSFASSIVIKGSIGYVAPEYGAGNEVSTRGDVYNFAILLLELFTRKKPTDGMFVNGLSLHDYAKRALPNQVNDIIDPMILYEEFDVLDAREQNEIRGRLHGSLVSIIRMAVTCSDQLPVKRMTMSEVVIELHHIKEYFQGVRVNQA